MGKGYKMFRQNMLLKKCQKNVNRKTLNILITLLKIVSPQSNCFTFRTVEIPTSRHFERRTLDVYLWMLIEGC